MSWKTILAGLIVIGSLGVNANAYAFCLWGMGFCDDATTDQSTVEIHNTLFGNSITGTVAEAIYGNFENFISIASASIGLFAITCVLIVVAIQMLDDIRRNMLDPSKNDLWASLKVKTFQMLTVASIFTGTLSAVTVTVNLIVIDLAITLLMVIPRSIELGMSGVLGCQIDCATIGTNAEYIGCIVSTIEANLTWGISLGLLSLGELGFFDLNVSQLFGGILILAAFLYALFVAMREVVGSIINVCLGLVFGPIILALSASSIGNYPLKALALSYFEEGMVLGGLLAFTFILAIAIADITGGVCFGNTMLINAVQAKQFTLFSVATFQLLSVAAIAIVGFGQVRGYVTKLVSPVLYAK